MQKFEQARLAEKELTQQLEQTVRERRKSSSDTLQPLSEEVKRQLFEKYKHNMPTGPQQEEQRQLYNKVREYHAGTGLSDCRAYVGMRLWAESEL